MSRRSLYFQRKLGYTITAKDGTVIGTSQCGGILPKFVATFPDRHVRDVKHTTITAPMSKKKCDRFSQLTPTKGQ